MPCNCDHMEPGYREKESQLVCQNLVYVHRCLKKPVRDALVKDSQNIYGNVSCLDEHTRWLCDLVRSFNDDQLNRIVYDGRNPDARKLATWWDNHLEVDRKRIADEAKMKATDAVRKTALEKLSKEELEALGL